MTARIQVIFVGLLILLVQVVAGLTHIGLAYAYNQNLHITAGRLTLTRSSTHGLLTGLAIGDISTSVVAYNDFAEPTSIQTKRGATPFFTANYTNYDKKGRITGRSEVLNLGGGPVTTTWVYEYDDAPGGNGPGRL